MWTFLAALAGGLIALLGSAGTTWYIQRQAITAERRTRATRAADEILTAVTQLRELPGEPPKDPLSPGDHYAAQWRTWANKREALIYRIQSQLVLMPKPDFQERIKSAAEAMLLYVDLGNYANYSETGSRDVLCTEIIDCLGAFYQGKPLPPERKITTRMRTLIDQYMDLEDTT